MASAYSAADLPVRNRIGARLASDHPAKLERAMLREFVARWLSREEHLVITLYYCEELTTREIAAVLKLPEERVEAIHQSVLARMETQFLAKLSQVYCVA